MEYTEIGQIGNYYGGLFVATDEGKYYWLIENWDTDFDNIKEWDEISKELYDMLIKHNSELMES